MSRPQHHKAVRLRLASAALGLGAALALTGCSAGQNAETAEQVAAIDGVSGDANGIALRDATLDFPQQGRTYPAGSSAPMKLVIANDDAEADRLLGASSPYASSVQVGGETNLPGDSALRAYGASGPGQRPGTQNSPAANADQVDLREVEVTLQGLTQEIGPGVTIPVTFTFEKAGELTVQVPIGSDPHPRPAGEEGGH